ncbi:hypothetical protein D3C81_1010790 [compost metagenome]
MVGNRLDPLLAGGGAVLGGLQRRLALGKLVQHLGERSGQFADLVVAPYRQVRDGGGLHRQLAHRAMQVLERGEQAANHQPHHRGGNQQRNKADHQRALAHVDQRGIGFLGWQHGHHLPAIGREQVARHDGLGRPEDFPVGLGLLGAACLADGPGWRQHAVRLGVQRVARIGAGGDEAVVASHAHAAVCQFAQKVAGRQVQHAAHHGAQVTGRIVHRHGEDDARRRAVLALEQVRYGERGAALDGAEVVALAHGHLHAFRHGGAEGERAVRAGQEHGVEAFGHVHGVGGNGRLLARGCVQMGRQGAREAAQHHFAGFEFFVELAGDQFDQRVLLRLKQRPQAFIGIELGVASARHENERDHAGCGDRHPVLQGVPHESLLGICTEPVFIGCRAVIHNPRPLAGSRFVA